MGEQEIKLATLEANYKNIEKTLNKIADESLPRINTNITEMGSRFEEKFNSIIKLSDERYLRKEQYTTIKDLDKRYTSKEEFSPIKKLVYGGVALILTTVVVAILANR